VIGTLWPVWQHVENGRFKLALLTQHHLVILHSLHLQCEILAFFKGLAEPRYQEVLFHKPTKPIPRLELDDALQAAVIAISDYAQEQYAAVRKDLAAVLHKVV